jgi:hypothetical protein
MIGQKTAALARTYLARPRDKSLGAFKEWIEAITARILGSSKENLSISEYEWIFLWNDFWAK